MHEIIPFTPERPGDTELSSDLALDANILMLLDLELELEFPSAANTDLRYTEMPFGPEGAMQTEEELPEREGKIDVKSSDVVWTPNDEDDASKGGEWDRDEDPEGD